MRRAPAYILCMSVARHFSPLAGVAKPGLSFRRSSIIVAWSGTVPPERSHAWNSGRAYAATGDTAKAKVAYQDFFALWKDADPDIPILKEAKAEYAKEAILGRFFFPFEG